MSRIHLGPKIYETLQNYVHKGHRGTFEILLQLLQPNPEDTVVEIGCGTGIFAQYFVTHGYDYWGIDLDSERVELARRGTPGANFIVHDALELQRADLPSFQRAFIHGVLHHLGDAECRRLLDHLISLNSNMVLAVIEPTRPNRWWENPFGALISRMDEGRYVRSLDEWRIIYGPRVEEFRTRNLWPRWPQTFLDTRLSANGV
jgi:SAM-dependent methyltransferase